MTTQVDIDALIRSRRKTIALEITEDARVVVRAPRLVPDRKSTRLNSSHYS